MTASRQGAHALRRKAGFALLLAAAIAASSPASAQPNASDKSAAETLFDEGRRLVGEGKFADACQKFADSNKLDPGVGTLLNLGQCYKSLGHSASAWSTFREAAALARASGQSDRETLARSEASALEPSLIRLLIEVPPEVAAFNPQIRRDGAAVPQSLWGLPAPVDPGVHVIEVAAAGKKAQRLEVSSSAPGSTTKVTIAFLTDVPVGAVGVEPSAGPVPAAPPATQGAQPASPAPAPSGAPAQPASERGGLRLTGLVVGGIGLAAAGAGVVFLVLGKNENDQALTLCTGGANGNRCANAVDAKNHENHVRAARDNLRLGYVGLGVGAAGIASALVLVALGSGGSKPSTRAGAPRPGHWALAPRVAEGELGLDLRARF